MMEYAPGYVEEWYSEVLELINKRSLDFRIETAMEYALYELVELREVDSACK